MYGSKYIVAYDTLRKNDGILVVVTLPWHVSHEEVAAESQLTVLRCVSLSEDVASLYALTLLADRTQVDGHVLVGTAELRYAVFLDGRFEADELLVLSTVVEDADCRSVNILDDTFALCCYHGT